MPASKRALDLTLGCVMLFLSVPVSLAIAIAIKLDSRGPVLFRQKRWGLGGQPFELVKFRTMKPAPGAEVSQALEVDPRVTRVGRLLRRTGLDELPQLINIVRGDMSFVGPRALAIDEALTLPDGGRLSYEQLEGFAERMSVLPGLTGPATVYIPKDSDPLTKFRYDLGYVQKRSFLTDIRLIVLSVWISLRGKWETRGPKY